MFNNTILKNTVIKKTLILTALASMFIVGCSNDQNYRREIEGNDQYLDSPALKPLIVPAGVSVPKESTDFYIYEVKAEGQLGKNLDIRPPLLPIPMVADSQAVYNKGTVTLDAPVGSGVWESIPNTLSSKNIIIDSNDGNTIKTANTFISRGEEQQAVEVSFLIQRHTSLGREYISVKVNPLGQDTSSNEADTQRYVVSLFNSIMDAVAPESSRLPPVKAKDDNGGNESTDDSSAK